MSRYMFKILKESMENREDLELADDPSINHDQVNNLLQKHLDSLDGHSASVREKLASNPNISLDHMHSLLNRDRSMASSILQNPMHDIESLAMSPGSQEKYHKLLKHPNFNMGLLNKDDQEKYVQLAHTTLEPAQRAETFSHKYFDKIDANQKKGIINDLLNNAPSEESENSTHINNIKNHIHAVTSHIAFNRNDPDLGENLDVLKNTLQHPKLTFGIASALSNHFPNEVLQSPAIQKGSENVRDNHILFKNTRTKNLDPDSIKIRKNLKNNFIKNSIQNISNINSRTENNTHYLYGDIHIRNQPGGELLHQLVTEKDTDPEIVDQYAKFASHPKYGVSHQMIKKDLIKAGYGKIPSVKNWKLT